VFENSGGPGRRLYNQERVGEGGTSPLPGRTSQYGTVALKVLREKLRQDKPLLLVFYATAKYGARVKHPNVVETIEIGDDNGLHFLAIGGRKAKFSSVTQNRTRLCKRRGRNDRPQIGARRAGST